MSRRIRRGMMITANTYGGDFGLTDGIPYKAIDIAGFSGENDTRREIFPQFLVITDSFIPDKVPAGCFNGFEKYPHSI